MSNTAPQQRGGVKAMEFFERAIRLDSDCTSELAAFATGLLAACQVGVIWCCAGADKLCAVRSSVRPPHAIDINHEGSSATNQQTKRSLESLSCCVTLVGCSCILVDTALLCTRVVPTQIARGTGSFMMDFETLH